MVGVLLKEKERTLMLLQYASWVEFSAPHGQLRHRRSQRDKTSICVFGKQTLRSVWGLKPT